MSKNKQLQVVKKLPVMFFNIDSTGTITSRNFRVFGISKRTKEENGKLVLEGNIKSVSLNGVIKPNSFVRVFNTIFKFEFKDGVLLVSVLTDSDGNKLENRVEWKVEKEGRYSVSEKQFRDVEQFKNGGLCKVTVDTVDNEKEAV